MRIQRGVFCLLLAVGLLAPAALASSPRIGSVKTNDAAFPDVWVEFDVRAAGGARVEALGAENVFVVEGGERVDGRLMPAPSSEGIAYVLAVDTSGSMLRLLAALKEALSVFVGETGPKDRIALLTFDDNVSEQVGFTNDRADLMSGIESLETRGVTTVLFYGVYRGLKLLEEPGLPDRKALIVVSDGLDEGSAYKLEDCVELAIEHDVTILSLAIPFQEPSRQLTQREKAARASAPLNLEKLSEVSGGYFLRAEPDQSWSQKLATLARSLSARWRFEWTSTLPADGQAHPAALNVKLAALTIEEPLDVQTVLIEAPPPTSTEPPPPPEPEVPWWRKPMVLIGAAGGLLLLLLLLGLWLMMRGRRRRAAAEAEAAAAAEEEDLFEPPPIPPVIPEEPAPAEPAPAEPTSPTDAEAAARPQEAPRPEKRRTVFAAPGAAAYPVYRAASFEVISGPLTGSTLALLEGRTTLGRDDDNNIVLDDEKVSLHHAAVSKRAGTYWIEDQGSTNGTFIGQMRLSSPHALADSEQVRLGNAVLLFKGRA